MSDELIGTVTLGATFKLVFGVGDWRGKWFASVRKFVTTQRYQGPTKSGFSLNIHLLQKLINVLSDLEKTIPADGENEFKAIDKGDSEYYRIITLLSENSEALPLVDIREYVDKPSYQGPTKRGIRFQWDLLPEVIACMRRQNEFLSQKEKIQLSLFESGKVEIKTEGGEIEARSEITLVSEVLGGGLKRFPEDFLDGSVRKDLSVDLPEEPLYLEQDCTGLCILKTNEGVFSKVRNPVEANYICYAQLRGHRRITIPTEMIHIFKAVKAYENYLRNIRTKLVSKILKKAHQQSIANYDLVK